MFLVSIVPHFAQVVAMDKGFDLLTRAWCVAELVEAPALKEGHCGGAVGTPNSNPIAIQNQSLPATINILPLTAIAPGHI